MKKKYEPASVTPLFDGENILNDDILVGSGEPGSEGDIILPDDDF